MTSESMCAMGEAGLQEFGLTRQKARYCHGLAARVAEGSLDLSAVAALPDAAGRSILLSVPGLGLWSVDIYYLMALRRPDVWPEGDLALASALREVKRMHALPSRENQRAIAARWSPWRSVAARLLWAHYLEARGQYAPRSD
jgi:DNA-3-methyladenine glycosylase II